MSFYKPLGLALPIREAKQLVDAPPSKLTEMGALGLRYVDCQYFDGLPPLSRKYLAFLGCHILEIREYCLSQNRFYGWAIHAPQGTIAWCYPTIRPRPEGIEVEWDGAADALDAFPLTEQSALRALTLAQVADAFSVRNKEEAELFDAYTGKVVG